MKAEWLRRNATEFRRMRVRLTEQGRVGAEFDMSLYDRRNMPERALENIKAGRFGGAFSDFLLKHGRVENAPGVKPSVAEDTDMARTHYRLECVLVHPSVWSDLVGLLDRLVAEAERFEVDDFHGPE